MVAAALPRDPGVQELRLVAPAHRPVREACAAGEEVDADPGEDDGRGGYVELFGIGVWVCIQ